MSKFIYSLYKTINLVNGKIYIGVHKETKWPEIDSYLGSGLALRGAIAKHRKENFVRTILCVAGTKEYVLALEKLIVNTEFINEGTNYNLCGGGEGPSSISETTRRRMSKSKQGNNNPNYCVPLSEEQKIKISLCNRGRVSHNKGKHSPFGALNGKRGADKLAKLANGRRRYYLSDGSWTWAYPKNDGTWIIKTCINTVRKKEEVLVPPPI